MATPTSKPSLFAQMRNGVSDIISRARLAAAAGVTFNGKRDLYTALGYQRDITVAQYRARFKRNAIANRVVSAPPKATWRGGGEIIEDEDPDVSTAFELAWEDFAKRLKMWPTLQRADVLAGLGRYSVILIGAPGKLEEEMPQGTSLDEIAYLTPYAEDDAKVDELDRDENSPRFGLPKVYAIRRINADISRQHSGVATSGREAKVHHSRIIHIPDGLLDDPVYGTPRLEAIWNNLDDLEKVIGGGAEAFWLRAHPGYHLDLDPEVEMEPDDEAALGEEVDEFEHGFRRTMRTRGMKVTPLSADIADISKPADAIVSIISAGTGIPKRILMGSERGELSSTQDKNNWDQRINDRRTEFAEPFVIGALIERMVEYGYSDDADYMLRWPQKQDLDAQEKGTLGKTWAGINKEMGDIVITPDEIRDRVLGLPPLDEVLTPEELAEMRDRNKPPAPVAPGQTDDEEQAPGQTPRGTNDDAEDDDEEEARAATRMGARPRRRRRLLDGDAASDLVSNYRAAKGVR